MNNIILNPDERVIKEMDKIGYGGPASGNNSLILTNQCLILVKKNLFGKIKETLRFPLSDIVVSEGEPQVHSGTVNNFTPTLDVYFTTGQERFRFSWDEEVKDWIGSICEVITGKPAPKKTDDDWLAETVAFAESFGESIHKIKKSFGIETEEEASGHCPSCGASIAGIKGETTKCPYCGSYYTF